MQVLSSLSSIPFYAPSAGFAPTNSADVSAIASSYAESAASGKLDSTASSSFYPSDNPSGFISSVNLSDYATTAYVDSSVSSKLDATASSQFLTAVPSDYATTAYVDSSISGFAYESAVSGWTAKQDALTFAYNTANQISSIDGSALGGMDEAAVSGIASAYAESAVSSVSGNYYTTANESGYLTAQVQASWSESASASPSYIQDKPDLVDIVAGPGIVIDNPDGNTLRVSMGIAGSWTDVSTEASYSTTNINAGSFKIMYNPALNLVALTCDVNVGAGESTFFTWSNRLKPVFNNMALGSNLYVGQSGLKQAAGSTSRWINGAFMWPVVGGN